MARRSLWLPCGVAAVLLLLYYSWNDEGAIGLGSVSWGPSADWTEASRLTASAIADEGYFWRQVPLHFPLAPTEFPKGRLQVLPQIQAKFEEESDSERDVRLGRQQAVKNAFARSWEAYKTKAFPNDELKPLTGRTKDRNGGWGLTLIDTLDTLWVMGMEDEFREAADKAATISFEHSSNWEINTYDAAVHYLGGLLAAYDLSGNQLLLRKAREVGDMLYKAFDNPQHMPIVHWDFNRAVNGDPQEAPEHALLAEIGSFCLEFTRLSLVTGDPRWYDAAERIREAFAQQQSSTKLPGMWPLSAFPRNMDVMSDNTFSLGAVSDSAYEYLPKMYQLTGGLAPAYKGMYEYAMATAIEFVLYRPMVPGTPDILVPGNVHVEEENGESVFNLEPLAQMVACSAGGTLALGGKLTGRTEHLEAAQKLVDGCIWMYEAMPLGIMAETSFLVPCGSTDECDWSETYWKTGVLKQHGEDDETDISKAKKIISDKRLPKGFASIPDTRYILRPGAIESMFVLYRITGRKELVETAWTMFETIQKYTRTKMANTELIDVTVDDGPPKTDSMESFWTGETLKYFYLMFSEPDLLSLDDWVFNTGGHPLKRLGR
ncbi:glycoside hydrolase family 47 protein [Xylariomycetidae sp. FL0641]|nr:glycoside hydrolase family 47 protein [Xylariomycetidae sp. FL0641]